MSGTPRSSYRWLSIAAVTALLLTMGVAVLTPPAADAIDCHVAYCGPPLDNHGAMLCPDGTVSFGAACPTTGPAERTLTVPPSAAPGDTVTVGGAGWPFREITLVLYNSAGNEVDRTTASVDIDGVVPAGTTLTIPGYATSGAFFVMGEVDGVLEAGSLPIIVDDGTVAELAFVPDTVPDSARYNTWFLPIVTAPPGATPSISTTGSCTSDPVPGNPRAATVLMTSGTGVCTVTASLVDSEIHATVTTVRLPQTLSFSPDSVPASAVYRGTFTPVATSDAGLTPVLRASGGCAIDAATGVVTMTSGTLLCTVTADQPGDDVYAAATETAEVSATKAALTVIAPDASVQAGGTVPPLSPTYVGFLGTDTAGSLDQAPTCGADVVTRTTACTGGHDGDYTLSYRPGRLTVIPAPPAVRDPQIAAHLTSRKPARHHWYRTKVTVRFTCTPGSAPLTAPCPAKVILKKSRADQRLTRTIHAADGGTATVRLTGIDIDRKRPKVKVTGARKRQTYHHRRHLRCRAEDKLSGVAKCRIRSHTTRRHHGRVEIVHYRATATDRAGNRRTVKGSYRVVRR